MLPRQNRSYIGRNLAEILTFVGNGNMDWSSVFDDEGEEEGHWLREEISSRTRILSLLGKDGYTPLVCYAFTVNYILGVGCLGIPFAFLQSGIVLGSLLVIALSIVSYITVLWVASATQQEITIAAYHLTKSTNPFIMSPFSSQVRKNHRVRNTGKSRQLKKHYPSLESNGNQNLSNSSTSPTPISSGNILSLSLKSVISSTTMESLGLLSSAAPTPIHHITTVQPGGKISYSSLSPIDRDVITVTNDEILSGPPSSVSQHHPHHYHQHTLEEEWHFASLPSSTRLTHHSHHHHKLPHKHVSSNPSRVASSESITAFQHLNNASGQVSPIQQASMVERMAVQELEVTDLVEEFLGSTGKLVYQVALMSLTYVGLLAYTQVFNETFRLQLWPQVPHWLPPFIFASMVVPLSCLDLQEQIAVQVAMSLLRFVSLGILVFGTFVALLVDFDHSSLVDTSVSGQTIFGITSVAPLFHWSGFGVMFTTAIFSQLFQHSVPGLIRPLSKENKKFIPKIFQAALMTTATLYILTGILCVLYFGNRLNQSVNLNFVGFTWGWHTPIESDTGVYHLGYWCLKSLAMIVVLFPALDTLSVFPLIAITLGNNLHAAFPHLLHVQHPPQQQQSPNNNARKRILWRLIAAIPPILCSLSIRHLVISLQIAGLCGILVALVFPALLHQHAEDRSDMLPLSWSTHPFQSVSCLKTLVQSYDWVVTRLSYCNCVECMRINYYLGNGNNNQHDPTMQEMAVLDGETVKMLNTGTSNVSERGRSCEESSWLLKHETAVSVMTILVIAAVALFISLYQMILQ